MQEVTVQKVASSAEARREAPPVLAVASGGVTEFKAGEAEWLRGPLSKETSYRLIVSGDMGPREIGKLIKVLKAQQAVLLDEDEAEDAD